MLYLNLTEGFNPYNVKPERCVKFKSFFFSGGEPHIKLDLSSMSDSVDVTITSRLTNMDELMMLLVAHEALHQGGYLKRCYLHIPYFPGSRQDRRMVPGEPLTSKLIAELINDCDFSEVITFDNHSEVSTALIDNCTDVNNHDFVLKVLQRVYPKPYSTTPLLISPDSGANKKIKDLAKFLYGYQSNIKIVKCDKDRDVATGAITGFEVYAGDLEGKDCILVDDICDGGGTFIGLAKELKKKNAGDIYLIVSHGIFSKPLKDLKPYFKKIYTTDSWRSEFGWEQVERDCTNLVEIIPFYEFIP